MQNDNETNTIVYTSREFQPMAETFSEHYAFVGPSLPEREERVTKRLRPLVYISLGTVIHNRKRFCKNCAAALADMDADAVLSVGTADNLKALGSLPSNIRAEERVDQLAVLQQADVFLTHCGMNSASEGLYFGVPLVMLPQTSEQGGVAARTEQLGAGLRLKKTTPEAIHAALETAMNDPSYRENAGRIGASFRASGGAKAAADCIESCCRRGENR